jgi:hypothetical protein
MSDREVVNINKSGWCALCCSNFCYCSKESLMKQVTHLLATIKERNESLSRAEALAMAAVLRCEHDEDCLDKNDITLGPNDDCECGAYALKTALKAFRGGE